MLVAELPRGAMSSSLSLSLEDVLLLLLLSLLEELTLRAGPVNQTPVMLLEELTLRAGPVNQTSVSVHV